MEELVERSTEIAFNLEGFFRKDQAMYDRVMFPSVDIERRVKFERKISQCGFLRLGLEGATRFVNF